MFSSSDAGGTSSYSRTRQLDLSNLVHSRECRPPSSAPNHARTILVIPRRACNGRPATRHSHRCAHAQGAPPPRSRRRPRVLPELCSPRWPCRSLNRKPAGLDRPRRVRPFLRLCARSRDNRRTQAKPCRDPQTGFPVQSAAAKCSFSANPRDHLPSRSPCRVSVVELCVASVLLRGKRNNWIARLLRRFDSDTGLHPVHPKRRRATTTPARCRAGYPDFRALQIAGDASSMPVTGFIPTLREEPADAEVVAQAFVRAVSSATVRGIYSHLRSSTRFRKVRVLREG